MKWSSETEAQVKALKPIEPTLVLCQKIYHLIDLTSLGENDTEESVAKFFNNAVSPLGHVAAVCVYPRFVSLAATQFQKTQIKIATVVNFPEGNDSIEGALVTMNGAIHDGVHEIDVVFPYRRFLAGDTNYALEFISACKAGCGSNVLLKVILETGAYESEEQIAKAAATAIAGGAEFLKTSTGKIPQGANLNAAAVLLNTIKKSGKKIGFKVSGGVRTVEQAAHYLELTDNILGKGWVVPTTFRIGASQLVETMLQETKVH